MSVSSGVQKEGRAQKGVAMLIKKKYKENIANIDIINERIMKIHMNVRGRRKAVITV